MVVYKHDNCLITYEERLLQLTQEWIGYVPSHVFAEGLNASLLFIEQNSVCSVLSDTSRQNVVHPEDVDVAGAFLDSFFQRGIISMAFVISNDIFTQFSLKRFEGFGKHKSVHFFNIRSEAQEWLNKKVALSFYRQE